MKKGNIDTAPIKKVKNDYFTGPVTLREISGITRPSESILKEQEEKNKSNENVLKEIRDQALELSNLLMKYSLFQIINS